MSIALDYKKMGGLVPAIIQDERTQNVLMLGYMNEEALAQTLETGLVTFYSRSKQRLWVKGETSGNYLELVKWQKDCDHDALLIRVNPKGNTCHKGTGTCFGTANNSKFDLNYLATIINDRKNNAHSESYTAQLLEKGINKVAQKVGEEAVELIIEAKDDNKKLFLGEAADLLYHYLVLLAAKDYSLDEVLAVLEQRHQ
ncbi:bifunctional phosphoribosyl-AMP cyclohydrolase/phosphoribosyl-ATP diphosphatase HisIE [Aureispira anguillae]|uniref:Histidine biosynthesis bifunctional protein HisIE n=1 Tax=Aureispira anguillae TaxID=2864201 RepID=A0A915YEV3_9BACT|nr:bifunctional phosphoribosyl-AMP cyclohydrolase/phosphoribosyl-ATP diphosphatase HisIE [Aureispira anguillae]BDS11834.1 bifunctional phosphoribosyl-AMP cyclohydrolase/phosphoribosyl-ATP diphosphatase HisIE [Aureispira anguillae]